MPLRGPVRLTGAFHKDLPAAQGQCECRSYAHGTGRILASVEAAVQSAAGSSPSKTYLVLELFSFLSCVSGVMSQASVKEDGG